LKQDNILSQANKTTKSEKPEGVLYRRTRFTYKLLCNVGVFCRALSFLPGTPNQTPRYLGM
jgi:hypothetical protein